MILRRIFLTLPLLDAIFFFLYSIRIRNGVNSLAQFTKRAIISTFLSLLEKHSLDKITVKDIVDTCGINRNTFYYYYRDIYDLIDDIFDTEVKRVINDETHYDTWYEELHRIALLTVENKVGITHIYYSKSRDVLENYLFAVSENLIRNYVEHNSVNLDINEDDKEFVCKFYAHSLMGIILEWIKGNSQTDSEQFLKKVSAVLEGTVMTALECTAALSKP